MKKVYGVGVMGDGKYKSSKNGKITKQYRLWANMIKRCYSPVLHIKQPTYKGCTVDKRWHNFQIFCEDIKSLKNYEKWIAGEKYQLDKDTVSRGNKIYSKEKCIFIPQSVNACTNTVTGLTYKATRESDGYQEVFTNQSDFARKYNLTGSRISQCISGVHRAHKGWIFETIEAQTWLEDKE